MNEQEHPNDEDKPNISPEHELQPPQSTPPVYAPPPTQTGFPPQAPQQYPAQQYPPQQYAAHPVPEQQYAAQPVPDQQYPAQPVPDQQYAVGQQQYAPGVAPAAATPRKGLPVGAWIGIGVGALVLSLIIISGILIAVLQNSNRPPTPIPAPPATEKLPEEDPGTAEELAVVTLDDVSNFSSGPFWGVPFESGWDIVRFDEQGVHEFTNATAGCQFLTYQGYGPEGLTSTDDRGATEELISTVLNIGLPWTAATADPTVAINGSVEVPVDWSYNVEMQRLVATYPSAGGDRQRQMLLRSFMPNNLALYAEVDCPATAAGNDAAQVILDGFSITEH